MTSDKLPEYVEEALRSVFMAVSNETRHHADRFLRQAIHRYASERVAAEREACATCCDRLSDDPMEDYDSQGAAIKLAGEIRSRGAKP